MAQNKEQLSKLLLFIKRLIDEPGNEDFVNGLRKLLNVPIHDSSGNKQLTDIEKYLGLDYQLDSATPDIDYSFIKESSVKNQLVSDYREMLRYRYGVRSHKIDFSEFCRYAILQVEQLLNYYYQNVYDSIEEIIDNINKNINWTTIEKVASIKSISLSAKLSAFPNLASRKHKDSLDFAREVRNEQSHRGIDDEVDEMKKFRTKLIKLGLPLTKNGEVYWNGISSDESLIARFNSIDKSAYWKYRYQLWRLREPFDDVIDAVQAIVRQIVNTISKQ